MRGRTIQNLLEKPPDPTAPLPLEMMAVITGQRREAWRRSVIVKMYQGLLAGPMRRGVDRIGKAERTLRRRYGIGARTAQRYTTSLSSLRGATRRLLLGRSQVCFCDLPAAIRRTAMRRFTVLEEWRLLAESARGHRQAAHHATEITLVKHAGTTRGTLYRWADRYRRHNLAGLVDLRSLRLIGRGGGG